MKSHGIAGCRIGDSPRLIRLAKSAANAILLISLVFATSCKRNPVKPPDEVRNARNYTWVRDTLADGSYQSSMTSMWGSSPSDVYVVGHSSDEWQGKIWHYNGNRWSDYTYAYVQAFQVFDPIYFAPVQVYGFGLNDVWIVGYRDTSTTPTPVKKGFILHYTGGSWEGVWLPTATNHYSVGGMSSSDLWVGGLSGQMFHYNGNSWQEYSLNDSILVLTVKAKSTNEVYAAGWVPVNGVLLIHYYQWNGTSWNLVESRYENDPEPGFQPSFDVINGLLYSANYQTINKRISQGVWQQVFYNQSTDVSIIATFGSVNAFAMGWMSDNSEAVYHFDGNNWARIQSLNKPNGAIIRAWSNDSETFLLALDRQATGTMFPRSYVLRGK